MGCELVGMGQAIMKQCMIGWDMSNVEGNDGNVHYGAVLVGMLHDGTL